MLIVGFGELKIDKVGNDQNQGVSVRKASCGMMEVKAALPRFVLSADQNQRKCMQSDKRGRVRLFCIGGSPLRPRQEQHPWRCDRLG
jgi:hypothetical protein